MSEEIVEFLMGLRSEGIQDLSLLRALEMIPRRLFVPHRYADLAGRDVGLPLACGQTMSEPSTIARMVEGLILQPNHRVLEIGTGSGYATAILANLCSRVVSIERFHSLALGAKTRLEKLNIQNVEVLWADGLNLPSEMGLFDRLLIHGTFPEGEALPPSLSHLLAEDGRAVFGRISAPENYETTDLIAFHRFINSSPPPPPLDVSHVSKKEDEKILGTIRTRLRPLIPGISAYL